MRKLLSWLLLFCLLCSALCGVAYGAEIPNLDELVPDPWGDFNAVTVPSVPSQAYIISEDVIPVLEDMDLSDDVGIMPMSVTTGSWTVRVGSVSDNNVVIYGGHTDGGVDWVLRKSGSPYTFPTGRYLVGNTTYRSSGLMSLVIPKNSSYSCSTTVSYSASDYGKLYLSGTLSAYPLMLLSSGNTDTYLTLDNGLVSHLIINDVVVGDAFAGDTIDLDNYEIDLSVTGDISSIGIYVTTGSVRAASFRDYSASSDNLVSVYAYFQISDKLKISTSGGEGGGGVDEETKGLLATIIQWLSGIKDGIVNLAIKISQLPGLIADEVVGRLRSFFLPTDADLQALKTKYQTLMETRFGFIYQGFQMVDTAFTEFIEGWEGHGDYTFTFPGISFALNGETYVLCPPTDLDTNNELFTILRNFLGLMVCFICVPGFIFTCENMFIAFISGKSYFDYLRGQSAEAGEEGEG